MEQIRQAMVQLREQLDHSLKKMNFTQRQDELQALQRQMSQANFWHDNLKAQQTARLEAKLSAQLAPWLQLNQQLAEAQELLQTDDQALILELRQQLLELTQHFDALKKELQFSGKYDDHDAIVRLHAGAGGTDAQDWTEMLLRMYLRWAQSSGMKTELLEESRGEEAGIKSATISVSGPYAYGKLRGEHGVHRLVRLSPFNADHLRQTSFALVEVLPQIDAPEEVQLDEKELKIDVFRAGGHGGQSVNTTDSAVRVTHLPTGITVSIQNERSQLQNKETALKVLRSKLVQLALEQHQDTVTHLKGPTKSAEWGNQIRSYVLHPYTLVKDNRTKHEEHDAQAVLDGKLGAFIDAYLQNAEITS